MDLIFLVTYGFLWLLVISMLAALLVVIRELAVIRLRLGPEPGALATNDGPQIGASAPRLAGPLFGGGDVNLGPGRPALLLFISPHCDPCLKLLPELRSFVQEQPGFSPHLVCQGTEAEVDALTNLFRIDVPIVVDPQGRITKSVFAINTTPFGLALDEDWVVRSKGIPNQYEHLEALVHFQVTPQGERHFVPVAPVSEAQSSGK